MLCSHLSVDKFHENGCRVLLISHLSSLKMLFYYFLLKTAALTFRLLSCCNIQMMDTYKMYLGLIITQKDQIDLH